jgi:hypothetical protein
MENLGADVILKQGKVANVCSLALWVQSEGFRVYTSSAPNMWRHIQIHQFAAFHLKSEDIKSNVITHDI